MSMQSNVNYGDFDNVHLKGQGQSSYVIAADKRLADSKYKRILWRIPKYPKIDLSNGVHYIQNYVMPAVDNHRSQLIDLPNVVCIDHMPSQLFHNTRLVKPLTFNTHNALQMTDYTRRNIPYSSLLDHQISVELKPKQLSLAAGTFLSELVPYCMNCVLQYQKYLDGKFEKYYHYCPLDLVSGDRARIRRSVESLIIDPHSNLKLFSHEFQVVDSKNPGSLANLAETLRISDIMSNQVILDGFCKIFELNPALNIIKKAQKLDLWGPLGIYDKFVELPQNLIAFLRCSDNQSYNYVFHNDNPVTKCDFITLLRNYTIAATLRDCSVIYTINFRDSRLKCNSDCDLMRFKIDNSHFEWLIGVKLIDLDCKSVCKMEKIVHRLQNTADFIYKQHNCDFNSFRSVCYE